MLRLGADGVTVFYVLMFLLFTAEVTRANCDQFYVLTSGCYLSRALMPALLIRIKRLTRLILVF